MPAPGTTEIIEDTAEYQVVRTYSAAGFTTSTVWRVPPPPVILSPDEKLAEARVVLEQIGALPAPVLTADVVDLLDDLRGVL